MVKRYGKPRAKGRTTFRYKITDEKITKKFHPKNIELSARFLKNFATKRSPASLKVYRSNLNIFFTWNYFYNDNLPFTDIKKFQFSEFFDFCVTELKWSSNRFAQMHSCLSSFSTWISNILDEEYPYFKNLVEKIEKPPKEPVREKSIFTKDELDYLLKKLGEEGRIQEQCLLALVMATGSRVSELPRFTTDMIEEEHTAFDGLFIETTKNVKVKGRGVNGKYITKYIIKDMFLPYYKMWLAERDKIMQETKKKHDFIFIIENGARRGEPADVNNLRSWGNHWNDHLGGKHWYFHSGRHFWTTYLSKIGVEKELIQQLQQWSSDTLVDLYNDNTLKDRKWKSLNKLKEAMEKEKEKFNKDI